MQQVPLLQTKLYIPPVRPELVSRPRLLQRLNAGLCQERGFGRRLTIISAPAGFGKTTLASEWVDGIGAGTAPLQIAWLSLDEGDNEAARFLAYLVAALQTVEANLGRALLGALESPQPPSVEVLLTTLINEISALSKRIVLVLDDYHLIEARSVHEVLSFLLQHLPPQMHLVIATRQDPPLPLARLRARGQLTELRVSDLRFTPCEATEFLNQVMGLDLSAREVASLGRRTEGWIAGLQLAALALEGTLATRGREDVSGFINAFAGDNRYIVDYLVEEVLQRQPEGIRRFLLQTSILDRLSGPLCDAVRFGTTEAPSTAKADAVRFGTTEGAGRSVRADTAKADAVRFGTTEGAGRSVRAGTAKADAVRFGTTESPGDQEEGNALLQALERGNLFVVPLDDKRQWYRYHHLFADLLRAHLMEEQADRVPALHLRASEWFEQNDLPSESIRHALVAGDFERAADLAELAWPAWSGSYQSIVWLGWLKALPDELVRARPVLSLGYAWAHLNAGNLEAAEARLLDVEVWLEPETDTDTGERLEDLTSVTPPKQAVKGLGGMVVVDEDQFRSLPASLATARAYHAQAIGDVAATVKYARRVLALLPEGHPQWRGDATALLGLAYWASGDLEAAHRTMSEGLARMGAAEIIIGTFVLADIKMALGHLHQARNAYERALQLAEGMGEPMPLGTEDLYTGISKLHREQGDLEAAAQDLQTGKRLGEQVELPDWQYRWCIAQARLAETLGDLDGALELLDEAERVYVRTPLPDLHPIAALRTRIWVRQGRLAESLGWAAEVGLSVEHELSYLREFEHITLVKVMIAQYKGDRAGCSFHEVLALIDHLLQAAEKGQRTGSVIEILVLQALAHQAEGEIPFALLSLERALTLAEPEGYVRVFVDEGPPMAALLREAAKRGIVPDYAVQLLAVFGKPEGRRPVTQPLVEPLSERELEVLGLLGTELNGPEIARELVVSLNTMRTHTKNIYGKLGVNSRRAAVRRAEELELI